MTHPDPPAQAGNVQGTAQESGEASSGQAKHTGPWEMPGQDDGEFVICTDRKHGKRRTIAHVYDEDDAHLIKAAPDLLAALKRLTLGMNSRFNSNPAVDADEVRQARAAIARAENRS